MDWNEYFFRHVYLAASKSKDPRTHIGAVLVREGIIISEGFNGFPRGVRDTKERLCDRQIKLMFVAHAESNSIFNAARNGTATLNSILYTNATPCNECAKSIIQAGIKEIFIHKQWEDFFINKNNWVKSHEISEVMFKEAQISIKIYNYNLNIQTLCNGEVLNV